MQDVRRFSAARIEASHPAALVASELATNAITHANTPFTVSVQRVRGLVHVKVSDSLHTGPKPGLPPFKPRSRPSHVDEFSKTRGTRLEDDGKTVWAAIPRQEHIQR